MRRALAATVGTAAGLAALLGYKSGPPPRSKAAPVISGGGTTSNPATGPSTSPPSTSAPRTATTLAPDGGLRAGTFTGPVVTTRYGDVEVRVTVAGGRVVDVAAVELPFDRRRSASISDRAAPILRREALAAQGADIDTVSGATYTSEGYARSLQAALDAARR
jgi:uncharacterized protein with FMN-binding domain